MSRIIDSRNELFARGLSGGSAQMNRRRANSIIIARRYRDNTAKANGYNSYLDLLKSRKERNITTDEIDKITTATREQRMGIAAKSGSNG